MTVKIKYRERNMIDCFRCIDTEKTITLSRCFWSGNLLYGYVDRYNTRCISKDDIIAMENL